MATAASATSPYTRERYFALVDSGLLRGDDRIELLDGVIVAMSPQSPLHASTVSVVARVLGAALGDRAALRVQAPFVAGDCAVPEPDVAVVPGREPDYDGAHPTRALLIVEVADSSLVQDRLTKAAIYAAAEVPEYWIVNLRDDCLEILTRPHASARQYSERGVAHRGDTVAPVALADVRLGVDEILPKAR